METQGEQGTCLGGSCWAVISTPWVKSIFLRLDWRLMGDNMATHLMFTNPPDLLTRLLLQLVSSSQRAVALTAETLRHITCNSKLMSNLWLTLDHCKFTSLSCTFCALYPLTPSLPPSSAQGRLWFARRVVTSLMTCPLWKKGANTKMWCKRDQFLQWHSLLSRKQRNVSHDWIVTE